jgi:hypothetical protein
MLKLLKEEKCIDWEKGGFGKSNLYGFYSYFYSEIKREDYSEE